MQVPGITARLKQINMAPPLHSFISADNHTDLYLCIKSQTITLTLTHIHIYTTQIINVLLTHTAENTKHITLTQTHTSIPSYHAPYTQLE